MIICHDCGELFEDPKTVIEYHPYGMGYAPEEHYVCPHCESSDIAEAKQCKRCGEYFAELEDDDLCDLCYGEMYE